MHWPWRRRALAVAVLLCLAPSLQRARSSPLRPQQARLTRNSDWAAIAKQLHRFCFPAQKRIVEWMGDTKLHRIGHNLIAPRELEKIKPHLQPGDIMLARKNWYLSNLGLPGFWTHAGLYIGTPQDLEAFSGNLADDLQARFPDAWTRYVQGRQGQPHSLIEALSEGVVLGTLKQCRSDYLAVLRPRLGPAAKAHAITAAFSHLDKPYDFHFDFASDDALVCTELIWRCYRPVKGREGLRFQLVEIAGRQTLPANNIARLYAMQRERPDRQLDFVCFLDASEKQQRSFVADEFAFAQSYKRPRWDLVQK